MFLFTFEIGSQYVPEGNFEPQSCSLHVPSPGFTDVHHTASWLPSVPQQALQLLSVSTRFLQEAFLAMSALLHIAFCPFKK